MILQILLKLTKQEVWDKLTFKYIDQNIIPRTKKRIENNKPTCYLVTGYLGQGKTTLAVILAERYKKSRINYATEYAVGGRDFIKKLKASPESGAKVILYDEAGDFSKKRTLTAFNQTLNQVFEIYRAFNVLLIIVLPNFTKLDKGIYDTGAVRVLFNCHSRTDNKVQNYTLASVYPLSGIYYLLAYVDKYRPKIMDYVYKANKPITTFAYKDLPPERSKELHEISFAQKIKRMDNLGSVQGSSEQYEKMEEVYEKVMQQQDKFISKTGKVKKSLIMFEFRLQDRIAMAIKQKVEYEINNTQGTNTV